MQQAQQQMLAMGGPRTGPLDYPPELGYGPYDPPGLYDAYAVRPFELRGSRVGCTG